MNTQDAKFILRAHRSDGRYGTGDPLFAEALAETERDPALKDWHSREQALDDTIANKIDGIMPPPGLRESILVGARASRLQHHWWRNPAWLAAAAAILVTATTIPFLRTSAASGDFSPAQLAEFGLHQLGEGTHDHENVTTEVSTFSAELESHTDPMNVALNVSADTMRAKGCQSFTVAGHEIFEVCFQRDGVWYHLYVTRRDRSLTAPGGSAPLYVHNERYAAAAWMDAENVFTLVTRQGMEALRRAI